VHESAVFTGSTDTAQEVWFKVEWWVAERQGYDPEMMLPRFRGAGAGGHHRRRAIGPFVPARAIVPMHISPVPHPTLAGMRVVIPAERDFYFMTTPRCGWAGPPL
jgi:hypothetical protein